MFTSLAFFNTGNNYQCDRDVFLTWTNLVVDNLTETNGFSNPSYFPKTITKKCSIKAFSMSVGGNNYWRIYAVNHMPSDSSIFTADITGTPPSETAYKRDSQSYVTLQEQGGSKFRIIDELPANGCQFYNVES